jgi:hypothetical protein
VVLLDEGFESGSFVPGTSINGQNGWNTTIVVGSGSPGPEWTHEAHTGANQAVPKPHIVNRVGSDSRGFGNSYAAHLHWWDKTSTTSGSHTGGYTIELWSPPFRAVSLPVDSGNVFTVEFDWGIDLLRESQTTGHALTVELVDTSTSTRTLVAAGPAGAFRSTGTTQDMQRHVFEEWLFALPASGNASDLRLVLTANSLTNMTQVLYGWWIDDVRVLVNFQDDIDQNEHPMVQPGNKDAYESTGLATHIHPAPPYAPIENNNTMTHPYEFAVQVPGVTSLPNAWVDGEDADYYLFEVDAAVPVQVTVTPTSLPSNLLEMELYRVDPTIDESGTLTYGPKFIRAWSVAYCNIQLTGGAPLVVNAQHHPNVWWMIRVSSLDNPAVLYDYDLEIDTTYTDYYALDLEPSNSNDNRLLASPIASPYSATHYLHPSDEDWYFVGNVGAGNQILVDVEDFSSSDGLHISLILVTTVSSYQYADIDATELVGGQRLAQVANIPNNSGDYFVRIWRYWQTTVQLDYAVEYSLTMTVNATPTGRTVHAPPAPSLVGTWGGGGTVPLASGNTITLGFGLHLAHVDSLPTCMLSIGLPAGLAINPSFDGTNPQIGPPMWWEPSWTWDSTGTATGLYKFEFFARDLLYDRTATADDIVATISVTVDVF